MIIPFGTDRTLKRPTKVTYALVGANIAIFLLGSIWGGPRVNPDGWDAIYRGLWLDPNQLQVWNLFSYQFLHAGLMHLLGNMLFLWVFGPNVEDRMGRLGFLGFYLVGGAIAGGAHALLEHEVVVAPGVTMIPAVVGASGSIAAVTGAYLVLFPKTLIRVFFFLFFIGVVQIPAAWLIGFAMFKDLFLQGFGANQGVAVLAHIGGYVFGIGVSLSLLASGLLPREPYDLFSMGRQAHRRRMFKELTTKGHAPWSNELADDSKLRKGASTKEAERAIEIAQRRTEITQKIKAREFEIAGDLYRKLLDEYGEISLSRGQQYDLANHLFGLGRFDQAGVVYDVFLKKHPRDHEADRVKLMLAIISARYLNDPIRAKELLGELTNARLDSEQQQLALALTKELG